MSRKRLFLAFIQSERTGGFLLIAVTVISLLLANSGLGSSYIDFWNTNLAGHSITHWINDGLMAIFFLLIGLELKREIRSGELSSPKKAALPVVAAMGGMLVPALLYTIINSGTPFQSGSGIPMATDIAFAVGILSLVGNRVPLTLKIFLTALAVIDDLGAILVIAIFYSNDLDIAYLIGAIAVFVILVILNKIGLKNLLIYLAGGTLMWYFMLHSGVHATITGVLLAFAIPFGTGAEQTPSSRLQHLLHQPVALLILPLFALANTAIAFNQSLSASLSTSIGGGILLGLVIGKPLGIWFFSWAACRLNICKRPNNLDWSLLIGAGILGGIGFTMSIFITLLAFSNEASIFTAKTAIMAASSIAGLIGYLWLSVALRKTKTT